MQHLPSDATLADIISTLDNPIEYVRGVFGNMCDCKKEHGTAIVRIGTTGRGIVPHYRVEPELPDHFDFDDYLTEKYWTAFNGRNHKRLAWSFMEIRVAHWSAGKNGFDDVQRILGELRGFKQKVGRHAHRT